MTENGFHTNKCNHIVSLKEISCNSILRQGETICKCRGAKIKRDEINSVYTVFAFWAITTQIKKSACGCFDKIHVVYIVYKKRGNLFQYFEKTSLKLYLTLFKCYEVLF